MSSRKLEEVRCPCGEDFEAELWTSINAAEDPELKEALEGGEINVVCCPACSQVFYVEQFLLYHDPRIELMAFVYPAGMADQHEQLAERMNDDFSHALAGMLPEQQFSYRPLLMFGLDALVELIRREDELDDELAILEYLADEYHFSVVRLHPEHARRIDVPRLLPRIPVPGDDEREGILAGLRLLLQRNGNLTHFQDLLDRIEGDQSWSLPRGILIDPPRK